ncbi:hypothetical protein CDL12_23769 [Handroanthus impetiginosus]|uniref:Uncharacterized protein n=1 Tax=Handroanthus impetiginosus TaxID=429701 RepID=A0A2G9G0F9_9LAMI|nr:hypothetical protein CDL12_28749 [Handroanthus impetiginosus]PIN03694.1 hypothetical protein CDL12_23769 [Handroanthus impetiginosus]
MEGENSKQSKTSANAPKEWNGAFGTLFSVVNFDSSSGSRMDSDANLEGSGRGSAKISESLDAVSSSLSNSSSDELFQFNPHTLPKSRAPNKIPKPHEGTEQIYKSDKLRVPSVAWRRLEESMSDSPESISQFSDVTHESFVPHVSPTQFPPSQVMERNGNFDPNRIPDSIFSRPSTPTDWSVASNESLFSIQLGTESLPRDHALRMSEDIYQSGELPKSGEIFKSGELFLSREFYRSGELFKSGDLYKSGELKRSDELISFQKTSSAAGDVEPNEIIDMSKNVSQDMKPGEKAVLIEEPVSDVPKSCINFQSGTKLEESSHPSIANHRSAGKRRSLHVHYVIVCIVRCAAALDGMGINNSRKGYILNIEHIRTSRILLLFLIRLLPHDIPDHTIVVKSGSFRWPSSL